MRCVWLNKFDFKKNKDDKRPYALIGGAETTMKYMVEKGIKLGHSVEVMTPQTFDFEKVKEADLIIMSNIWFEMTSGNKKVVNTWRINHPEFFKVDDLDWIVEHKKFIKVEHDASYCMFRNPQCEDHQICTVRKCTPFWWRKLYEKASAVVFLSPLQAKTALQFFWKELGSEKYINSNQAQISSYHKNWANVWGEMINSKVLCIPPTVKKAFWTPSPTAVIKGTYAVVGAIYEGKGIRDILEQYNALGKNLRFIGNQSDPRLAGAIVEAGHTLVPPVTYDEMPNILRKYQYLVISRRISKMDGNGNPLVNEKEQRLYTFLNEGFGRIIPEALNLGLKILVDKDSKAHIGAYSYGVSGEEIIEMCDNGEVVFWDRLKENGLL